MRIKDVEKEVGISCKNIRFYEEEGLISVHRDRKNAYRNFTKEDIKKLKEIKLLRELDISLEDIRKYMKHQMSLQEVMDHHLKELDERSDQLKMMKEVCKRVRDGKNPLVPYIVNKCESALQQHRAGNASKLLGLLGEKRWNERAVFIIILLFAPVLYLFLYKIAAFMYQYFYDVFSYHNNMLPNFPFAMHFVLILATLFCLRWLVHVFLHMEYFEFREEGIYYLNKDCIINDKEFLRTIIKNDPYSYYHFLPYEEIRKVKFTFQSIGRITGGDEIFENIFVIFTIYDEAIRIDSGVLGSQENIKMTADILKDKSKELLDPYHLFDALQLSDEKFYAYLKRLYEMKHPPYRWKRRNKINDKI